MTEKLITFAQQHNVADCRAIVIDGIEMIRVASHATAVRLDDHSVPVTLLDYVQPTVAAVKMILGY